MVSKRSRWLLGGLVALSLAGCGASSHTSNGRRASASQTPVAAAGATQSKRTAGANAASSGAAPTVPALVPPANPPQRSVQVPVLTYHRVHTLPAVGQLDLIVDPTTFLAELEALRAGGYHTIHQWQLFDALYKRAPLPPKPVIISVDDGYVDDVRTILPDLLRMHMVATFFVITGRTTEPGFLDDAQIRQLDRAGMDVGDHTAHHVDLAELGPQQLAVETAGSRRALEAILGHPVYFFAYPFGAYNAAAVSALHAAGFTMAYTTTAGTTETTAAPLTMPRLHVGRNQTPAGLVATLGNA
jgi:peptidoglycan/xylan/chitin deacetylase (PgdA/CDA1 family)